MNKKYKIIIILCSCVVLINALSGGVFAGQMMMSKGKDNGMMCGMMQWMPKTGIDPGVLPDPDSQAAKAYASFCPQCHPLQSPKRYSAKEWEALLERMDRRMRMMGGMKGRGMMGMMRNMPMMRMMGDVNTMSKKEKGLIMGYLTKYALPVIPENQLKELNSPEAKTFKRVCSQCHDLPIPSLYKQGEWKTVLKRMKENMEEMNVPAMKQEEEKQILAFLNKGVMLKNK